MILDTLSQNAGLIGLLFFFIFFVSVAIWTFRPGAKSEYEQHGNIPLQDDKELTHGK